MFRRARRPVKATVGGALVPVDDRPPLIEAAAGERQLYRSLAELPESSAAVAHAASQWGPLARTSQLLSLLAPAGGVLLGRALDELADSAKRWAAGSSGEDSAPLFAALSQVLDLVIEAFTAQLVAYLEVDGADVRELQAELQPPDEASATALLTEILRACRAVRTRRYPPAGAVPRWASELDAADGVDEEAARFGELLDELAAAVTPEEVGAALAGLVTWGAALRRQLPDDLEFGVTDALVPLFSIVSQVAAGHAGSPPPPTEPHARDVVTALLDLVRQLERAASIRANALLPTLSDADTWRSLLVLITLVLPPSAPAWQAFGPLVGTEQVAEWRRFATECARWRDAIDAQRRWEGSTTLEFRDEARHAWRTLRRSLSAVLPLEGAEESDIAEPEDLRFRLVELATIRCSFAAVEPRPRQGLVGTEGRALWSIRDALAASEPARPCAWPEGCGELLPAGSYAHRRYCDQHRREANRRRAAAWRARRRRNARTEAQTARPATATETLD